MPPSCSTIKPIFIVGRHRSGTTWLANILASLPDIYTPTHELHKGQHESAFFSNLVPYCNWGNSYNDLLAIKNIFEASDFFRLLGLGCGPNILALGYAQYFREVLNKAAEKNKAGYWLEKTPAHTCFLGYLKKTYSDAVFIAVARNDLDVVRSNVYKFGNFRSLKSWFKEAIVTGMYNKITKRYCDVIYTVRYEDLVNDYQKAISGVLEYLGLDSKLDARSEYKPDSSYDLDAPKILAWQLFISKVALLVTSLVPAALIDKLIQFRDRRKKHELPKWFFKVCLQGEV